MKFNIIITLIALPFIIYLIINIKKRIIDQIKEIRSINNYFKQEKRKLVVVDIKRIEGE